MGKIDLNEILNSVPDTDEVVKSVLESGEFDPTREIGSALPYTKRVSYSDLIPEPYQQRLMALDWSMSQSYFEIGDITNELINSVNRTRASELGKVVSKTDLYEAVGVFIHRTARSVRYYWEVSHWFPPEVRVRYEVPFNVYAIARWVEKPEVLLQLAVDNPIWTADRVRSEYYRVIGEEPPVRPQKVGVEDSEVESDLPEESESSGRFKAVLLSKLDHVTDGLRIVLDRIPLPVSLRKRIGEVLLEIGDIALEIRRM
jgi:hypothetical protein